MQQYRVNYSLLIGMIVGGVVGLGATYGIWRFQIERNAGTLITAATEAQTKGDLHEAADQYSNYLSVRPSDVAARVKLANIWLDVTEQSEVAPEDWPRAISFVEETVRSMPDEKELQRRLADLYGRIQDNQNALDHINRMVQKYPDDSELQILQMEYLTRTRKFTEAIAAGIKLIGYDEKTDAFDSAKAAAIHKPNVYGTLASIYRSPDFDKPELADRIMEELIKQNPDSAEAYLQRGRYLLNVSEEERGQRDLEKAYKLAPDNADVLLSMADLALKNEKPDQAHEYLEQGVKKFPLDSRFYQGLASLAVNQKDNDAALKAIDEGLKAIPSRETGVLLLLKADFQARLSDAKGLQETAEAMRKAGFRAELVEWIEAQVLLAQNKWFYARKALTELRPKLGDGGSITDEIDNKLGLCNERLGFIDKAREQYEIVLQHNPNNEFAKFGKQRTTVAATHAPAAGDSQSFEQQVADILAKPKETRDWAKIDALAKEFAEKNKLEGIQLDLFWAKLMLMREDYAAARKHLADGQKKDPENLDIMMVAVLLVRFDPSQGPEKAIKILDERVIPKFGDQSKLRLLKGDLLLAINNDGTKDELKKLADVPTDWKDDAKIELLAGMTPKFLAVGMRDEAQHCLERVADLRPDELPTRLALFSLAVESNDDVAMRSAQKKIEEVVGSQSDSTWQYTEARRKLSEYRRGDVDKKVLTEVRTLIDKAMKDRPDWFELHLVNAEVELLSGDEEGALKSFNKAEQLGKFNPTAILQHVRLLLNRGQYQQAKDLVEQLPKPMREGELAQVYAEILLNTGHIDEAVEIGQKFVDAAPTSGAAAADAAARQLAYGQLLARCSGAPDVSESRKKALLDKAGEAFARSTELNPEAPEGWLALVTFQVLQKNLDKAQAALRAAQLYVSDDQLVRLSAKCYELMGGKTWFDAENMYLATYQANPENLAWVQQLATFYLGQGYPLPDRLVKATPLVNQILRAGADKKLEPSDPTLMWARRMAAQILAATKEYQQLLNAEKLLASNAQSGVLPLEDRMMMAQILAQRPEPVSRVKAIQLLEQQAQTQKLSLEGELTLGQLYYATGEQNWPKCKKQMLQTVTLFPKSADARAEYIRMVLERGTKNDYNSAAQQLAKLREMAPGDGRTISYTVELANKTNKQQEAKTYLLSLLPKVADPKNLTAEQLGIMEFVATLLVKLNDVDNAEKIFRTIAAREPSKEFAFAAFLGEHRDVQKCMDMLDASFKPEKAEPTARVAIAVVRARRDEIGDKYDTKVSGWIERALLENPDSLPLMMLQAEFADVRKQYDEAAAIYRKLLARKDVTGVTRAIVLNNLAFLVSLAGADARADVDPLKLVQEASQILGPTTDILDTRAIVYTAQKQYQKAIDDLNYAVTDTPTASKYFHLAQAYLGAGQNKEAIESWEKAEKLARNGDVKAELNRMEYEGFEAAKTKIDQLRSQNARLTDADRPRAAG